MPDLEVGEDRLGADGDTVYEALMNAHDGLSEEDSHALNIRLVLLMANHIGDLETLTALIKVAKEEGKR